MTADPYARLDAVYLLGALDADERLAYEAHLAICRRCRAGLAEISAIPSVLAGLDESVFAAPPAPWATSAYRSLDGSAFDISQLFDGQPQRTQRVVGAGLHRAGRDAQGMRGLFNRAAEKVALPQHIPMLLRQPA